MEVLSLEAIHKQMAVATEKSTSDHYCREELSEDDMWYENVLLPAFQKHETLRHELQPGIWLSNPISKTIQRAEDESISDLVSTISNVICKCARSIQTTMLNKVKYDFLGGKEQARED